MPARTVPVLIPSEVLVPILAKFQYGDVNIESRDRVTSLGAVKECSLWRSFGFIYGKGQDIGCYYVNFQLRGHSNRSVISVENDLINIRCAVNVLQSTYSWG